MDDGEAPGRERGVEAGDVADDDGPARVGGDVALDELELAQQPREGAVGGGRPVVAALRVAQALAEVPARRPDRLVEERVEDGPDGADAAGAEQVERRPRAAGLRVPIAQPPGRGDQRGTAAIPSGAEAKRAQRRRQGHREVRVEVDRHRTVISRRHWPG